MGEYDATTGATINATFIGAPAGVTNFNPWGLALNGSNHLFLPDRANSTVGEYDATTGATINSMLIDAAVTFNPFDVVFVVARAGAVVAAAAGRLGRGRSGNVAAQMVRRTIFGIGSADEAFAAGPHLNDDFVRLG